MILICTLILASLLLSPIVLAEEPGTLKWKYETGDWLYSSPAIAEDGKVYVGSGDGHLYSKKAQVKGLPTPRGRCLVTI